MGDSTREREQSGAARGVLVEDSIRIPVGVILTTIRPQLEIGVFQKMMRVIEECAAETFLVLDKDGWTIGRVLFRTGLRGAVRSRAQ
jgi:hypothetical protein